MKFLVYSGFRLIHDEVFGLPKFLVYPGFWLIHDEFFVYPSFWFTKIFGTQVLGLSRFLVNP